MTDRLRVIDNVISQAFSMAKQQRCLFHIARNLLSKVKRVDRPVILEKFKKVYQSKHMDEVLENLETFMNDWSPKYKKLMDNLAQTRYLLTFFEFSPSIRKSIYSTNLIESLNKEIKRQTKKKITFSNDYNFKNEKRIPKAFGLC